MGYENNMEHQESLAAVEMLRVMLVDDEPLALQIMESLVDWEDLGFRIVASCSNGKRALEAFAIYHPHVIFVDIDMPIMNGLQFLNEINRLDTDVITVILSAHSKFEYAQKAISAGALDYVIKEDVTEETLTTLLKRIDKQISISHQERTYMLERYVGEVFNSPDEEYLQMMQSDPMLHRRFDKPNSYLICELDIPLPIASIQNACLSRFGRDRREYIRAFRRENLSVASMGMVSDGRLMLEMAQDTQTNAPVLDAALRSFGRQLQEALASEFNISVSIFIIAGEKGLYNAARQYQRYRGNIANKYLVGTRLLLPLNDDSLVAKGTAGRLDAAALYTLVEKWEYRRAIQEIRSAFEEEKQSGSYLGLMNLYDVCVGILLRYGPEKDVSKVLGEEGLRICLDVDGSCEWICAQLEKMAANLERTSAYSREVRKAVGFIRNHYTDPSISNQRIADHVGISSSHLGYLFKRETGRTMVDFLTETRIEAAKVILLREDVKIYQAAEQVGYSSSQYFSQVFLRQVGCKPGEYQKQVH